MNNQDSQRLQCEAQADDEGSPGALHLFFLIELYYKILKINC